jgi:hypothetical protein
MKYIYFLHYVLCYFPYLKGLYVPLFQIRIGLYRCKYKGKRELILNNATYGRFWVFMAEAARISVLCAEDDGITFLRNFDSTLHSKE